MREEELEISLKVIAGAPGFFSRSLCFRTLPRLSSFGFFFFTSLHLAEFRRFASRGIASEEERTRDSLFRGSSSAVIFRRKGKRLLLAPHRATHKVAISRPRLIDFSIHLDGIPSNARSRRDE